MKQKLLRGSWIALSAVLLCAMWAEPARAARCSTAASAGKYGFTLTGTLILPSGPAPFAAVGRATVDTAGKVTGTEARNVGGEYADETLSGSLTVNSDCTGTMTLNFYENGQLVRTSVLSTVTDDNGRELRMVQKSLTLPNGVALPVVATVDVRRMFEDDED